MAMKKLVLAAMLGFGLSAGAQMPKYPDDGLHIMFARGNHGYANWIANGGVTSFEFTFDPKTCPPFPGSPYLEASDGQWNAGRAPNVFMLDYVSIVDHQSHTCWLSTTLKKGRYAVRDGVIYYEEQGRSPQVLGTLSSDPKDFVPRTR